MLAAVSALAIGHGAWAQSETVTVKRDAQLRESPADAAPSLASLPAQTPVTRLTARRGPWIEVRTAQGQTGWVHLFDVGTAPAAQGGNLATGALRGLTSLFGGGNALAPATRTSTATIGIRGLGAEEIASAQPNLTAVMMMETLRVDAGQAQQFGAVAGLAPQRVEPLPVPPPPGNPATPATGAGAAGDSR
jgi:hypothetical protein